jgi:ketosteroid isomerase-like protein
MRALPVRPRVDPSRIGEIMGNTENLAALKDSWAAFGEGDFDRLATFYAEDMQFILPGQDNVVTGRDNFRAALDGIGAALPPGFEVTGMHYFEGDVGLTNVVEWKSDKCPGGSQSAIRWTFNDAGKVTEERWFIDTVQWNSFM